MLENYLSPLSDKLCSPPIDFNINQWGSRLMLHTQNTFPDLTSVRLAIVGVCEDRSEEGGCQLSPDAIRKHLYPLYFWTDGVQICDLGNIVAGETPQDTYFALQSVLKVLMEQEIVPIILGGICDLTYGQFLAHAATEPETHFVFADEKIALFNHTNDYSLENRSFLYQIIAHKQSLNHFAQIGYLRSLVDPYILETLENLNFDCYSLGEIRKYMSDLEPILRDANMFAINLSCLRAADAPAVAHTSSHGFSAEEACQMTRYAGLSDHIRSIGFYEYNPLLDLNGYTAQSIAQMIWYFVEGFYERKHDFPHLDERSYIPYIVSMKDEDHELVFLKSRKSDRWWLKVPLSGKRKPNYILVPCSYRDYEIACRNEIPDRWLKAYWRATQ